MSFRLILIFLFTTMVSALSTFAQSAAEISHKIKSLQKTTRVLYLAAHPDDENTRVISWLENDQMLRTAYLSLTRGDGGQNLIGTELGAKLGVLRTQELMQARAIDGGEQFFTRAVDFGYSKTADETFKQWDREAVLADVVWVIRKYQPHIIITRFPPDGRGGHGHHTASAILAEEAYELASDPKAFPEQLEWVDPWQVQRLFWNHSTWWNQNLDSIAAADDRYSVIDVGAYNASLGLSCNEIASHSRTQHKSQGFGVSISRGSQKEYLQLIKGSTPKESIFSDLPYSWANGGWPHGDRLLKELLESFDPNAPHHSLNLLLKILDEAEAIEAHDQRLWLVKETKALIKACLGLQIDFLVETEYASALANTNFKLEITQRLPGAVSYFKPTQPTREGSALLAFDDQAQPLALNEKLILEGQLSTADSLPQSSQPYWLQAPYQNMFMVSDPQIIGLPENPLYLAVKVPLIIEGQKIGFEIPLRYRYSDRVEGEINKPFLMVPPLTVKPSFKNLIFVNEKPQYVVLEFTRIGESKQYDIELSAGSWSISPAQFELNFTEDQKIQRVEVQVKPGEQATQEQLLMKTNGKLLKEWHEIDYPHIDRRLVLEHAEVKLTKLSLTRRGERVAYIPGAGDEVAKAIERMGYHVDILDEEGLRAADLNQYQAVIAGIRAYNTQEWLPSFKPKLMEYVKQGGNYIVQYNTRSRDLLTMDIGPYPFEISRERVTEEDAPANFTQSSHPVLNEPNKLTEADFEAWVQERGLYFAGSWDERYQTPIAWHDEGEPDRLGGLLIGEYGDGAFIYTGISFFRELPAGVGGAYRLFANLISFQNGTNE